MSAAGSARRAPAGRSPVGAAGRARTLRRAALGVGTYCILVLTLHPQAWPQNRGDLLAWDGHKRADYAAMDTSFNPGRVYLRLRRLEEAAGSLNIFPRWEVHLCNNKPYNEEKAYC